MTWQIGDSLAFRGHDYRIVGVCGSGMFQPQEYGLLPTWATTACWTGYSAKYAVAENQLILQTLLVNNEDAPPAIQGIEAAEYAKVDDFNYRYSTLSLPIGFTGGLVIADKCLRHKLNLWNPLYDMGDPPFWHYSFVLELEFLNGELSGLVDMSSKMETIRENHIRQRHETGDISYPSLRGVLRFDYEGDENAKTNSITRIDRSLFRRIYAIFQRGR